MKNGNISNKSLPLVLVRIEDTLLHEQKTKIKDKIQNLIKGSLNNSLVDRDRLCYVLRMSKETEFSVVLGLDTSKKFDPQIYGLGGFHIMTLDNINHIRYLIESGIVDYYLDENKERISLLSNNRAMTIDEFRHISGVK